MKNLRIILSLLLLLPICSYALDANEIARKSYNVNHSLYIKNMMIKKKKRTGIVTVSRMPGEKPRVTVSERFLSNEYDGNIESKDLIIMRSGKLNGLGVLMTSYVDRSNKVETFPPKE